MGDFYQVSRHAVDIYVDSEARLTLSRYLDSEASSRYLHRYSKYLHNIDSEARSRYQHRYSRYLDSVAVCRGRGWAATP